MDIQATVDRDEFLRVCGALGADGIEMVVQGNLRLFSGCLVFDGTDEGRASVPFKPQRAPTSAQPVRQRKPRSTPAAGGTVTEDAVEILAFLQQNRAIATSEGFQSKNIIPGLDNKRRSEGLALLEREGKAKHNGKPAGGRRWFLCANGESDE